MNGLLKQNPLAELVWEIKSSSMGGALRLVHDKYKCVIYFSAGDVLFTTSNVKAHRLRECLIRWNALPPESVAQIDEKLSDPEIFNLLIERGVLGAQALEQALSKQSETILVPALLWTEGEWAYDPFIRLSNISGVRYDSIALLLHAVRRLPPDYTSARFPDTNEILTPAKDALSATDILPTEAFLLTRLDVPMRIHELLAISGLGQSDTLHAAYCLVFAGLVERSGFKRVFSNDVVKASQSTASAKARTISMEFLAGSPSMPTTPVVTQPATPVNTAETSLRDLEVLIARLADSKTFYDVLDVGKAADEAEIKRVYYALARRFHPDHFRHHSDPELHAKVESTFAKIAQAYETLRTPKSRAAYDSKIGFKPMNTPAGVADTRKNPASNPSHGQSGKPPASGFSQSAEDSFQRGTQALKQENYVFAAAAFSEAIKLAPKEAKYRAWYGRALAGRQQTRRQAEAEIQSAIAMDKTNPLFYVMLAELYRNLGLLKRAQSSLDQALAIDPRHAEAKELMNSITRQS